VLPFILKRRRELILLIMVEYNILFIGCIVCVSAVSIYSVKKVSQNAKDMQVLMTAVSGKSKEYAEVKSVDKFYEDKPEPKKVVKKEEKKVKVEEMLL